ncbi:uncharacterized protein LOC134798202 [Cydia splendana]|uniref:uncharacterized protein LOC134798202 n=1 Tax=Cydia splendana TaxID=1100963 RepID=UPI002138714B
MMSMLHSNVEPSWQWETNAEFINDPLAVIYHEGQWTLSKVSPLNNLQYNRVKLKQYASKIRLALVSSVSAKSSVNYAVQFDQQSLLKYCEDDADALKINVATTTNGGKTKMAYTGILMSWGVSSGPEGTVHLPYMLERGEKKVADVVKICLQKIFDCNIKPLSFTQYQLLMFGFSFVECASARGTDPFVLSYTTPGAVDIKNKLDMRFEVSDVHYMWNALKDEVDNMSELISQVYQILQKQIMHTIQYDISFLDIFKITLLKAEIKSNGIVKMKSPEVVNSVFTVLNEIICNETPLDS